MIRIDVHHYFHTDPSVAAGLDALRSAVVEMGKGFHMDMAAHQAKLAEILAQQSKVFGEVKGALEGLNATVLALQEALANAGNTTPDVDALVVQIGEQLQATDALIPDTPPA